MHHQLFDLEIRNKCSCRVLICDQQCLVLLIDSPRVHCLNLGYDVLKFVFLSNSRQVFHKLNWFLV